MVGALQFAPRFFVLCNAMQTIDRIQTHDEFRSPFVTPTQRRQFLLDCAQQGLQSIRANYPDQHVRMFVFGSTVQQPVRIGSGSDLDIAVSGLDHIATKGYERGALLLEQFKKGLSAQNQTLPVDVLTFDADHPQTWFAREILAHGLEIKLDEK